MSGGMVAVHAVALPFLGAIGIALAGKQPDLREAVTLTTASVLFVLVMLQLPELLAGGRVMSSGFALLPGVPVQLTIEPFGQLFAMIAASLWIANSVYSIGYMRANSEPRQTSFYVCFAIAIGSTIGIAYAGNLFTLFVFYEILTLSTYPLVTHRQSAEAMRAGRTYLLLLLGSSIALFLPAILWTWHLAGRMDFVPGGILAGHASPGVIGVLLALFVFGIGKAAVMPGHRWLPAAMIAPTPVSALLHAVAVVKAGVFSIVKIAIYVFGLDVLRGADAGWLPWVAGATVVIASLIALRQDDLKRRLAYSTVSQLSYVVLAVAILAPLSTIGAMLHILGHAFGKITLFFAAGAIYTASHKTRVSELAGIGWRMPWTMGAFAIGAIAMIGLPPTAGFLGKWFILSGALSTGHWLAVAVILASTVLNAAYYLPILHAAFFRDGAADDRHGEAPLPMVIALGATAAMTVLLFFFPSIPFALARAALGG